MRKKTKTIYVGKVVVGGNNPISVQSMTNTDTKNVDATVNQILKLEKAGCNIIRSAINSLDDAKAIPLIKEKISIPFVADIQFDYKLGLYAVDYGCDCLRINPGNIGDEKKVKELVNAVKKRNIPIRIGVNSGSLSKSIIDKYNGVNSDSLVASAMEQIRILEDLDFYEIKLSIKSSNINTMIDSYEKISSLVDYPLHLGVTEAGPVFKGTIKSAIGIGYLLKEGIGDTIRVSLTGDPLEEVKAGTEILRSMGLLNKGVDLITCPTCSRTRVNLIELVNIIEKKLENIDKNLKVAIMGCPVNGPGEAKEADIGVACGDGYGVIFKKGKLIRQVDETEIIEELMKEIEEA